MTDEALNLLFRQEHSRVYLEDIQNDDSSYSQQSMLDDEEAVIYNEMHQDADEVTSGYSTISSSKEEEYLSCHLAN